MTDLLNYGIMESNKPYKKGTTNKRNQESTEVRTARSADLGKYGYTEVRESAQTTYDGRRKGEGAGA